MSSEKAKKPSAATITVEYVDYFHAPRDVKKKVFDTQEAFEAWRSSKSSFVMIQSIK